MRQATVDKRGEWKKKHEEQGTYVWQKKKRDSMELAWLLAGGIRSRQLRRLDWSRWPLVTRTRLNFSLCTIPKEI